MIKECWDTAWQITGETQVQNIQYEDSNTAVDNQTCEEGAAWWVEESTPTDLTKVTQRKMKGSLLNS